VIATDIVLGLVFTFTYATFSSSSFSISFTFSLIIVSIYDFAKDEITASSNSQSLLSLLS